MNEVNIGTPPVINGTNGEVITTTVDGQDARIDTREPVQPELIAVSLEALAHDLVVIDQRIENAEDELSEAKTVVNDLNKQRKKIIQRIKDVDGGVTLLPFEPDEPEVEEDEIE